MASRTVPVILVGRSPEMGSIVADDLRPEVEVLHFISTLEAAKQDVPLLLQRKQPSNSTDAGIGSQMYSKPAEAVLLGLGYTNEVVDEIRYGCADIRPGVPWLTGGLSNAEFEKMMRTSPLPSPKTQGPLTAEHVKRTLVKLLSEDKGGRDGVYS